MKHKGVLLFVLMILVIVAMGLWQFQWDITEVEQWIHAHRRLGAIAYVVFLIGSVVLMPFSSLPLLPVAARVFGVTLTGILSILGWWIGCLIAFLIARMFRPVLERITSLEEVEAIEKKIPPDIGFAGIVILRMILPTDVTSFALGLLKHLSFRVYAIASLIGIIPFAFVWAAAGGELSQGEFLNTAAILIGLTLLVLLLRLLTKK